MDRIRNEYIRGTAQVEPFRDKVGEVRLGWFKDVQRRDTETMVLPDWRKTRKEGHGHH